MYWKAMGNTNCKVHFKATVKVLNNDNAFVYTRTGQLNVESNNIVSLQPRRAAGPGVPALFAPGPLDHQLVTRKGGQANIKENVRHFS